MVRCVCNHAACFRFLFYFGLLAVPLVRLDFESAPLFFCRRRSSHNKVAAMERRVNGMSRVWHYKYGGFTTSSHPDCPARVLLHGRCPKGCPERNPRGNCSVAKLVDHVRLEKTTVGDDCFVSSVYYTDVENSEKYKRLKAVCDFHGLHTAVEIYPWNGMKTVSHIKVTK